MCRSGPIEKMLYLILPWLTEEDHKTHIHEVSVVISSLSRQVCRNLSCSLLVLSSKRKRCVWRVEVAVILILGD
ncbi:hypothetical protein CSUI_007166 [Cystoisospora suis]|uniref:Uncharacterized protein n=1 Tax=Cystoisospora suis TaxID=483139 RepID=A0A2C6KET7_9APIC|nr:hypothetical protein CSUI_007166 [Cystoisospora suis]